MHSLSQKKKPNFFKLPSFAENKNLLDEIEKKLIDTESLRQTLMQLQTNNKPKKKPRFLLKIFNSDLVLSFIH